MSVFTNFELEGRTGCLFVFFFFFGCAGSSLLRRLFSSCDERGLLFIAACGLLIAVASLVSEPGL